MWSDENYLINIDAPHEKGRDQLALGNYSLVWTEHIHILNYFEINIQFTQ